MSVAQPFPLNAPQAPAKPSYGPDLAVRLICPDCRDPVPKIVEEFGSGDLVCATCGLVLGDRIVDTRSEWRTFANDEGDDPSRVGAAQDPLLDEQDQLATAIGFRDGNTGVARELQRAASRGMNGARSERSIQTAFREISNMCDSFSLPKSISDIAKQLYKRADEEKLLRAKSLDAVIAACIFIACRQAQVPRTFREICELTRVPKKIIGQCYKTLEQAFNLAPGANGSTNDRGIVAGTGPEDLLVRYCNHLGLPPNIQSYASDIIVEARNQGIAAGRSPVSIAGAAIFFTCHLLDQTKSVKDITGVAGVSEGTLKLVYKLLYADREKLVKQEWIDAGKASLDRLPSGER
ncbi:cyclin-like protein [Auricularia subglabra TFB-10046 SS5]|nr:cyclin-like protein [Auricularia subglabra TFB-10046 SS5]